MYCVFRLTTFAKSYGNARDHLYLSHSTTQAVLTVFGAKVYNWPHALGPATQRLDNRNPHSPRDPETWWRSGAPLTHTVTQNHMGKYIRTHRYIQYYYMVVIETAWRHTWSVNTPHKCTWAKQAMNKRSQIMNIVTWQSTYHNYINADIQCNIGCLHAKKTVLKERHNKYYKYIIYKYCA